MSTTIEFASNQPADVDRFLTGDNFDYLSIETRDRIRAAVSDGLCRVRNPLMYGGTSGLVPETGVNPDAWHAFVDDFQRLNRRDYDNRPKPVTINRGDLPDGYRLEWGERLIHAEDGRAHIAWWDTGERWEKRARNAEYGGYWRVVGPPNAIPDTNAPDNDHIETATDAELAREEAAEGARAGATA